MQFDAHAIYWAVKQNPELMHGYDFRFQCTVVEYNLTLHIQVVTVMVLQVYFQRLFLC